MELLSLLLHLGYDLQLHAAAAAAALTAAPDRVLKKKKEMAYGLLLVRAEEWLL